MVKRKRQETGEPDSIDESAPKRRGSSQTQDDEEHFEEGGQPGPSGAEAEDQHVEKDFDDGWRHPTGRIEYVKMHNFMCHAQFVYKPTGRINFLSGANGSGKSAILAALLVNIPKKFKNVKVNFVVLSVWTWRKRQTL